VGDQRALAEEGPADADDRRALLDRNGEVVGHPHRQLRPEAGPRGPKPLRQHAQSGERRTCVLGSFDEDGVPDAVVLNRGTKSFSFSNTTEDET
jgi:hypothetical protein